MEKKEIEIAKEIRSLISGEIFDCIKKAMIIADESNDTNFESKKFIADCGLAYVNLHEKLLVTHIYSRYPELENEEED